ncbi:MAG: methyltransferase [bacterium]|nr:methyltransferase [bacterium]
MSEKKFTAPDAATVKRWREDIVFRDSVRGCEFDFHATWGLFSPRAIDEGSRLLLDHLEVNAGDDCLDVGCGYGVLGMTLAKLAPQGRSVMVDKDFVAVDYTRRNCERNGLKNTEVILSNGFNQIPADYRFDLIVSNLPAKVGNEQHYLYLFDAYARLRPGGRFVVVTITGLREFIARTCKEVFGNYDKIKQGKTYTVAQAIKPG